MPFTRFSIYIYIYIYISGSIGWGAGLQSSRLAQGKGSNPLKVLIKENKMIYQMYKSAKFGLVSYCHYISLIYIYIYIYIYAVIYWIIQPATSS